MKTNSSASLLRREIHPAISMPARENGQGLPGAIIDFVSSDETLDRYDEIIVAAGWQLENYRLNPVVQNAHNYGDILFTLGKALITEVRANRLFQRIEFATEINPIARIAYGLYQGKFLNAVSVGFIPLRWENGGAEAGFYRKYLEQELVEVSAVGIPANPNALQLALQAGAVAKADLQEVVGRLEELAERSTALRTPAAEDLPASATETEPAVLPARVPMPSIQSSINPSIPSSPRPPRHQSLSDFCLQLADPGADTGALGAGVLGAPWKQLTQLIQEIGAVLRRA